ncbi:MAG: DnaD domain protein [Eubacteriales bacterium]|nr:DnaD domain protein [Eubacteriales bacterium]
MKHLTLSSELNAGFTSVSNIFIDKYMPQASGEFVKIYLYLLRSINTQSQLLSVSSLADTFNQTEADVMRALRYWDKMNVINLCFQGPNQELSGICFCSLMSADDTVQTQKTSQQETKTAPEHITPIIIETKSSFPAKPVYSPAQLENLSSQEDLKLLLYVVSTYFGKTLSTTEASTIIYLYDTLNFPADLIEYLVEYCVSRDHKSMRYIETVALDWASLGIKTVKAAKEQVLNHNETTYSVMNAFGISNRNPGQHEKELISKWTDVYCFSSDMIIEACNRTIKATHQPSFEYADSILSRWKEANVKNASDIRKADSEYELSKSAKKNASSVVNNKTNRFNNFQQRTSDDDDLESTLLSNNG